MIDRIKSEIRESVGVRVSSEKGTGLPIIESHKTRQIQTIDELIQAAKIDLEEWEIDRAQSNVWHQMSAANGLVPLYQVKATLKRRRLSPEKIAKIVKNGIRLAKEALRLPLQRASKNKNLMIELAIPDLHLGKLAWADETGGEHWDTALAANAFRACINNFLARIPDGTTHCLFPIGNDFFNSDSLFNATTEGTPQHEDGRWQKTFGVGEELAIWAITRIRKVIPNVEVVIVPGNHDQQRAWYLGELLARFFAKSPGITIDNRPLYRKYKVWGDTLIGFTHGDRISKKELVHLAQYEAREEWGKTKHCEFHLGHLHQESLTELGGVKVRILPSLCPPDAWHAKKGYVMSERSAMMLVYDLTALQSIHYYYPE